MTKKTRRQNYQQFLTKLRQARESAGLSQEEAGQLLRRNQSYISRYESGGRMISVAELFEFAETYKVSIRKLLE